MEDDENIARKLQSQFDEEHYAAEETLKMDEALAQKLSSSSHQLSDSEDEMPITKAVGTGNRKSSTMSSEDEGSYNNKRKEPATKEPEMEKIKRRRSTFGRSRRSISSFGGRRSLLPVDSTLSLRDQVQNIPTNLPATTRKSQLFDIVIRETLRRYEVQCVDDDDDNDIIDEIKPYILTKSENIASAIAYQSADQPIKSLDRKTDEASCHPDSGKSEISAKVAAYRAKTKKLEEEYRQWKTLIKQRKNNVKASEQELHEAVSGESKIEEDQSRHLSVAYREFLDKRPDYQKYLNNTQCIRQQTILVLQNATRVGIIITAFIDVARSLAENCYHIAEQVSSLPKEIGTLTERVRQLFVGT